MLHHLHFLTAKRRMADFSVDTHYGVYALVFDHPRASILLIKKALGAYTGLYDLPGGTPDAGETDLDTMKREVQEETGCTVVESRLLGRFETEFPWKDGNRDRVLRHISCVFLASVSGTPSPDPAGGDSAGCVFVPLAGLSAVNAAPPVLAAIALSRH